MGNLIWHDWARLVTITASVYAIWSGYWGLFYRKFFWDMAGGILRDPGGFQPQNSQMIFINMIVKAPVLQLITILTGLALLVLEIPPPFLKNTSIHRNFVIRVPILLLQTFTAILFYQGTNAAVYSFIATLAYTRALMLGEKMEEAKANRGGGGDA